VAVAWQIFWPVFGNFFTPWQVVWNLLPVGCGVMEMKRARDKGFSLVELLVVVVLIGLLGVLSVPWLMGNNPLRNLNAAARAIQGNIQQARLLSQRENRPVYVDFGQDLNGDANPDCIVWRDLGNPPLNQALDLADNNGDGVPDEVVGGEALFLGTPNQPYGRGYQGIAIGPGVGAPAAGPPNLGWVMPALFWDPVTNVPGGPTGQRFQANPDGTCTTGAVFIAEAGPQSTRAVYAVVVSPTGSPQLWRWTATRAVWERL
jgi:prepilin-type N-terminal cleavage/methylation domain-containing protein